MRTLIMFVFAMWIAAPVFAAQGIAILKPTSADSQVSGEVKFTEEEEGLRIEAQVSNALPGKHGFHVHQFGSCEDQGNAAGGHYNPDGNPHGDVIHKGMDHAHAGDLGNIEVGADGKGSLNVVVPDLTLTDGVYNIAGRGMIVHEKTDDFGQPTGNAGGRIACGTIAITQE